MRKHFSLVCNFRTQRTITEAYEDSLKWLDDNSPENYHPLKTGILYIIEFTELGKQIKFRIRDIDHPRRSLYKKIEATIEFNDRYNYVEIQITIQQFFPNGHNGVSPYYNQDMFKICKGVLGELSPDDLAQIYPEDELRKSIEGWFSGAIRLTVLVFSMPCVLMYFDVWGGLLFAGMIGVCWLALIVGGYDQHKKHKEILKTIKNRTKNQPTN